MSMISASRSALASVEEKVYGFQTSLSVYVGLVRASIQDKYPLLQKHALLALFVAFGVVVFVQTLILVITFFTKTFAILAMVFAVFGSLLAYVPILNKWV